VSTTICPNGHASAASDYCDVCGAPLAGGALDLGAPDAGPAASPGAATVTMPGPVGAGTAQTCPNCHTENRPTALFCEACGYDFTTGTMPRAAAVPGTEAGAQVGPPSSAAPAAPGTVAPALPLEWVVEVWVDPDWYEAQETSEPCPSPGLPQIVPLTVRSLLVGRTSRSRNIHPDIACDADTAVSRRHAQLTSDGSRWWVEDLGSSNGTFVGPASGPLPEDPLVPGQRRELAEDDRIYIGAWTRLVVRRATEQEKGG
jgi:hypothetical protein